MNQLNFTFDEKLSSRLDKILAKHLKPLTRSQIKMLCSSILVNGKIAKMSTKLKNGDRVVFVYKDLEIPTNEGQAIPLDVIYEDEDVIVIDKRQGMVVHPSSTTPKGTLVNALNYYRLKSSPIKDEFSSVISQNAPLPASMNDLLRLGIVHRLDKDTSGVIVTARNIKTQEFLKNEFKKHLVKKTYIAILEGVPKDREKVIKTSIFRNKNGKFIASSNLKKGRLAVSKYKVLKTYRGFSLVKFRIFTGRTHQIRVHAKYICHPVLGDAIYGKPLKDFSLALHSYKIELDIAENKHKIFKAKLPLRFKKAFLACKKEYGRK